MARPYGTKKIESTQKYQELWEGYRATVKSNPKLKHVFVGKDGKPDYEMRERPLTWDGFEIYVMQQGYLKYPDLSDYCSDNPSYADYLPLSRAFKKEIRVDHIEGGMTNTYNQSITASLHGLKTHNETEVKGSLNIPNLPDIGNRGKK